MKYLIILEPTSTGFSAYSPDLDGCVAAGQDRDETVELMREALRTYFWLRGLPEETPTAAELRAIRRGRAEIKRGHFVTLDQLSNELASPRRKARAKRT